MESAEAHNLFSQALREALDKFHNTYCTNPELFNEESLSRFVSTMKFECENVSNEEITQAFMTNQFLPHLLGDRFIKKTFEFWQRCLNASTNKKTVNKVSFSVGDESPELKKTHFAVELISDTKKQTELLNKHLAHLNPDVERPFLALKLNTANPENAKNFLDGLLELANSLIQNAPIPIKPTIRVVAGADHVIIEVSAEDSLELNFFTIVFGHLLSKLPEYDLEFKLNIQTGTNFKHLIDNHSDNTVHDLLNGFKFSLELQNNLAGFIDEIVQLLLSKNLTKEVDFARLLSFVMGSLSLTSEVNLNLGANELELMAKLPKINIFDKEGVLAMTPISQAKSLRDSNEMVQMILPSLSEFEGKGELFVSLPFFTVHVEGDVSGILDLANETVELHGN